jgi:hypothetical protein
MQLIFSFSNKMGKTHIGLHTPYKRHNSTRKVPGAPKKKKQKVHVSVGLDGRFAWSRTKTKTKTSKAIPMREMNGGTFSRFRYRHKKSKIYKGFKLMSNANRYYTNGTVRIS